MTTLFSNVNTASTQIERETVAISQDAIKEYARAAKVTARAVAAQVDIVNAQIERMNYQLYFSRNKNINSAMFSDLRNVLSVKFLHVIDKLQKRKIDLSSIAQQVKQTDSSAADFLQIYAIKKVYNVLETIALENYHEFNAYTKSILLNMLEHGSLTNQEAYRCVCTSIKRKDGEREVKAYYHSALSTASTQVSSSRMTLRALNICNVQKNKVNDEMTFNNDEQYTALVLEILQMKENTAEERAKVAEELRKKQLEDDAKKAK